MILVWLFGIIFVSGPVGGAAYALANGFSAIETALLVSLMHLALVPVWLAVFHFLKYEVYQRRYFVRELVGRIRITKNLGKTIDKNLTEFRRKLKRWSLGTAVFGLTLLLGLAWAALIATLLKIERTIVIMPIAAGAIISGVFWSFALAGAVGFLPEPWMLYLILVVMTLALLAHGKLHEREMLREMSHSLKRLSIEMEEYPVLRRGKRR
jgi:ABC-type sugar transport system permease subunit